MKPSRILVTGSNGLLGQKLLHTLNGETRQLIGIDLTGKSFIKDVPHEYRRLDLTDKKALVEAVIGIEPQVIVHTAAMTAVDKCEMEKELCWNINVTATDNVITAAKKVSARVIFISSDYIFDGKKGPYKEEDLPNPVNYYGRSKLAAENILRGSGLDFAIIRTIVLYGIGIDVRASFVTWLLEQLRARKSVRIVNDQWGNTTIVDDLAAAIDRTIALQRKDILHVAGHDYLTRYEFALKIADFFELNRKLIIPIPSSALRQPARRPKRSGLEVDRAESELYMSFRTVEESLTLYKNQEDQLNGNKHVGKND